MTTNPTTAADLRKITEGAKCAKTDATEAKIAKQFADAMAFCKPYAMRGLRETTETYTKDLCPGAVARLRSVGLKVRDYGEDVASCYKFAW